DRSGKVRREYLQIVWKAEQLAVDAVVDLRRVLAGVAREIGTTHGPDEHGVAGEHEPRLGAAAQVGDDQRNALGCMTGRVKDLGLGVAEVDLLPITEGFERNRNVRGFVQAIRGSDIPREGWSA